MNVEVSRGPVEIEADVVAPAAGGLGVRELDALLDGRLARAAATADPASVVQVGRELRAPQVAVVALDEPDPRGLRTAVAQVVRTQRGGTVAWALDESLPLALHHQVQSVVEGAVLGGYDPGRRTSDGPAPGVERLVVRGAENDDLRDVAARAEPVARWTSVARELVDGPPNVVTPASLADRAGELRGLRAEVLDPAAAGLPLEGLRRTAGAHASRGRVPYRPTL